MTHSQAPSDASSHHGQSMGAIVNEHFVPLQDRTSTGSQILAAANLRPDTEYALLHWPAVGPTREIGLEEVTTLPHEGAPLEFIAVKADGVQYFVLDGQRFAWAGPLTFEAICKVGRLANNLEVLLERRDEPDLVLAPGQEVDLRQTGVEHFSTREKIWKLDVQGELTEWNTPKVVVRDALIKAGIDPNQPWNIILKVHGQAPQPKELHDIIDLDQPGIERLWLRPKEVNNGEVSIVERRQFKLLPKDEVFLNQSGNRWETVNEGRRWLIIHDYQLPTGYNVSSCTIAVEIPASYPTAQIDMFFCDPHLQLVNGTTPQATEHRETIDGKTFQRWSRHRPNGAWSAAKDSVATHFGLVEEALCREVGV